jgi:tyrosine-protein phosphatase SIW14
MSALPLALLLALVQAAPPPFAEKIEAPGIKNFAQIGEGYYRGAQPAAKGYLFLKNRGVKTIVSLRNTHNDRPRVEAMGMKFVRIPLKADAKGVSVPTKEQIAKFLDTVLDSDNQPVFVHCAFGDDRTGLMTAIYRLEVDGWTAEDAVAEMRAFGFHEIFKNVPKFLRKYKPYLLRKK